MSEQETTRPHFLWTSSRRSSMISNAVALKNTFGGACCSLGRLADPSSNTDESHPCIANFTNNQRILQVQPKVKSSHKLPRKRSKKNPNKPSSVKRKSQLGLQLKFQITFENRLAAYKENRLTKRKCPKGCLWSCIHIIKIAFKPYEMLKIKIYHCAIETENYWKVCLPIISSTIEPIMNSLLSKKKEVLIVTH